ncbi:MAG: hypothetical protein DHS20C14_04190 [Phycisphaeraceae bacterium]|nr:MAG: hypothetical protein DHS20C14_04190 [Phycisphaeraceae bacterium]
MFRSPAPGYGSTRTFWQKLGIYCVGIAIGLLFLGWVQIQKRKAAAHQQQQQEATPADAPAPARADDPSGTPGEG